MPLFVIKRIGYRPGVRSAAGFDLHFRDGITDGFDFQNFDPRKIAYDFSGIGEPRPLELDDRLFATNHASRFETGNDGQRRGNRLREQQPQRYSGQRCHA